MKKINQEEYEILKGLNNMWKWIAREEDRGLYAFTKKPVRKSGRTGPSYWDTGAGWSHPVLELIDEIHLFQFIQWEDEELYNIAELIEEYESGETEVNKQELTKNIKSLARETSQKWPHEEIVELSDVLRKIDQLDEPEVLSNKWIDEHLFVLGDGYPWKEAVPVVDLQNLLVPKQGEITEKQAWEVLSELYDIPNKNYIREAMRVVADYVGSDMTISELKEKFAKPVIPQFVSDWYESEGKRSSWCNWFYKWGRDESRTELETKTIRWMQDFNEEKFVNMFLHGYEMEEEQKYYVMNNDNRMMLVRMMDDKTITEADPFPFGELYDVEKKSHRLTEQEIKDYDKRYWVFAEPVEELVELNNIENQYLIYAGDVLF